VREKQVAVIICDLQIFSLASHRDFDLFTFAAAVAKRANIPLKSFLCQ